MNRFIKSTFQIEKTGTDKQSSGSRFSVNYVIEILFN